MLCKLGNVILISKFHQQQEINYIPVNNPIPKIMLNRKYIKQNTKIIFMMKHEIEVIDGMNANFMIIINQHTIVFLEKYIPYKIHILYS